MELVPVALVDDRRHQVTDFVKNYFFS
jgi:hypothetical protein